MIDALNRMIFDLRQRQASLKAQGAEGVPRNLALAITALEDAQLRIRAADAGSVERLVEHRPRP
jgi:hypothetical protein